MTSDSYFGIRTLRQGTAISHSQYGNFTDLGLPELLVARGSRVDVYKVKPTGELLEVVSLPLNGRVAYMQLLKRPGLTDTLFVCTSKCSIAHLSWDAAAGSVVSHATGRLCEFCGKRYGRGDIVGDLSPDGRLLCLGLYRCELHFVVISPEGELSDAFSVALPSNPQLYMRDYRRVQFLHQATVPTLVVLSRDCRAASLYTVDVAEKSIGYSGPLALWPEGKSAVFIQATPLGGVFAGFDGGLTMHINPWRSEALSATTRHTISRCARVTDTVYVGCDRTGGVYILSLSPLAGARVGEFVAQRIGDSYVASTLCVVGSKLVFVGSMFWDGKLARITPSPRVAPDDKLWLEKALAEVHSACLLQTTGPITDFCPLPHSGEIAACIGGHSVAAAAILRTQFTLNDVCVYRISDVHSLWVLPDGSGDGISDRYIVMSFGCGTFVLRLDDGGTKLSPYHIKGISRKTQTLYCALLPSGKFLRVTQQKVIIVDTAANTKKDSFLVTHSTMEVNCVSFTRDGTVGVYSVGSCALNVTHVVFGTDTYKTVLKVPFPADVAALDACSTPGLCAVALWDGRVGVFSLPDIGAIATKMVPGLRGAIRSVVLGKFAGCGAALYLICGTSEGLVVVYVLSDNDLKELWRMDLGMEQVTINAAYVAPGSDVISHVFASSLTTVRIAATEEEDADKVEYGYCGGGLCATYVKADEITSLCQFRGTVDGRDNIVVGIGNNEVKIFSISKKPSVGVSRRYRQKLYIPNKIVYQKETDVVATANVGLARSSSCFIVYDKFLAERIHIFT